MMIFPLFKRLAILVRPALVDRIDPALVEVDEEDQIVTETG